MNQPEKQKVKMHRVVLYIPEKDYVVLRSKLILIGKTVTAWFRDTVYKYLNNS